MNFHLMMLSEMIILHYLGGNSYSSLTVKGTVDHYISSGVPKEKLVVGAAFYGKVYEISTSSTNFLGVRPI